MTDNTNIPLKDLTPDPNQPRKDLEPDSLKVLVDSIKATGVVQAITVRPYPDGPTQYMIVDGERRWRASKIAGKKTIPAVILSKNKSRSKVNRIKMQSDLNRSSHKEKI